MLKSTDNEGPRQRCMYAQAEHGFHSLHMLEGQFSNATALCGYYMRHIMRKSV